MPSIHVILSTLSTGNSVALKKNKINTIDSDLHSRVQEEITKRMKRGTKEQEKDKLTYK
jgi:hypothetical protein